MDDKNSPTSSATEATAPSARAHNAGDGGAVAGGAKRFSAKRKLAAVQRLMRGESLDAVSREVKGRVMSLFAILGVMGLTGLRMALILLVAFRPRVARPVALINRPSVTVLRLGHGLDPFDLEPAVALVMRQARCAGNGVAGSDVASVVGEHICTPQARMARPRSACAAMRRSRGVGSGLTAPWASAPCRARYPQTRPFETFAALRHGSDDVRGMASSSRAFRSYGGRIYQAH